MSVICPRCGKDNISYFHDTVFKTIGAHCESCNHDFNVDSEDGSLLNNCISTFSSFYYLNKKDEANYKEVCFNSDGIITLIENKEKKEIFDTTLNIKDYLDTLLLVLFKKVYILDFPASNIKKEEKLDYIKIELNFKDNKKVSYHYFKLEPPYLHVIDELFKPLFMKEQLWKLKMLLK